MKSVVTRRRKSFPRITDALGLALTPPHRVSAAAAAAAATQIRVIQVGTFRVVQRPASLVQYHLVHFDEYSVLGLARKVLDPLNSTIVFTYVTNLNQLLESTLSIWNIIN